MMTLATSSVENDLPETHEINVTPFIDVMLVLLIIFMIAAPLATVDLPVDLPTSSAPSQPPTNDPIYITLRSDLTLAVGEQQLSSSQLLETLQRQTGADQEQRLYLRADKQVDYGDVMGLLDQLSKGGYRHVALVGIQSASPTQR
ncbi:MAG: TonB system transport protein ExbD [Immundisolibacteraceae bacterium]|nr:TonB system transport protein ExbD [Immundisolibacteraceae bacterium]